jgi:hypothetical protein
MFMAISAITYIKFYEKVIKVIAMVGISYADSITAILCDK